ncbi:MAG: carboxypeptidase regulatory-like domain-containing protein [Pyrinomonadaceae bacterium]
MLFEHELHSSRYFLGINRIARLMRLTAAIVFVLAASASYGPGLLAQGNTSGRFEGVVRDSSTGLPISGATIVLRSLSFDTKSTLITMEDGTFGKGSLNTGDYDIEVSASGYTTVKKTQTLYSMGSYRVEPVPFYLEPIKTATVPLPVVSGDPSPMPAPTVAVLPDRQDRERANFDLNPRRGGIFDRRSVNSLPLGSTTLTRTFDELAFLIPGVNPPPQSVGNTSGPGQGPGVGTSGQFAVNGLRSRANNFTVDGSDNNDEDIGVRRQGFFSLVPQPIESIQEYQIITLLAPAEFGRNLGAQVNALSRSGGNGLHGTIYGLYNSDKLNSSNFFDNDRGNTTFDLNGQRASGALVPVFIDDVRARVTNFAGSEDKLDLLQGGFAFGGRLVKEKVFFFLSGEYQRLEGTQERHFAVPTVEQRGFVRSGASGLQQCFSGSDCIPGFPTSISGDAVFSLFPFPNDPNGIYGRNTYTQESSTDALGRIFSGKIDWNLFNINGNQQVLTARYNYTNDSRDLTDVGGALFSAIRPVVRTDNFSAYLTGGINGSTSNELRVSWGRTRLRFDELRDQTFLDPISRSFSNPSDGMFLLNAPTLLNSTLPFGCTPANCSAPPRVDYVTDQTTEDTVLGLIGQLNVAGFSPVGVDVFNFPQRRTNNTYQIADNLRRQSGNHGLTFGADLRRVFLASNLPRNSRPLVTFNGSPDGFDLCDGTSGINCNSNPTLFTPQNSCGAGRFCSPTDLASVGGASGFFQSLILPGNNASIDLSYNQLNFFAQDEWRISRKVLLSFGLRYELNTTPKEKNSKIESTFSQALPSSVSQLSTFIEGRRKIYEEDRNNFAPRVGIAAEITPSLVLRGGFGIFYDQIVGAVVGQSRNVFPTFTTLNLGGGLVTCFDANFIAVSCGSPNAVIRQNELLNPVNGSLGGNPIVQQNTLNALNVNQIALLNALSAFPGFPNFNFNCSSGTCVRVAGSPIGATLPRRNLDIPFSSQYSVELEGLLFKDNFLKVAFVGTQGVDLLRFSNPNLGSNYLTVVRRTDLNPINNIPFTSVLTLDPTSNPGSNLFAGRPSPLIGSINRFETTGKSRYDSLQAGLRGRLLNSQLQYQVNYVYGKAIDDVSDVFDLAGASALPQNSAFQSGEFAPANYDIRHRVTYSFLYDLPLLKNYNSVARALFGGWQMSSQGKIRGGQPFTVNSVYDVNLDGNLTDRLNNTQFITVNNGNPRERLTLTCNRVQCESMLAAFGQDGAVQRNSFRAGRVIELDASFSKLFGIGEDRSVQFRMDVFNFINRANFGVPVRFLESPSFGQATDTLTPARRFQFGLKLNF